MVYVRLHWEDSEHNEVHGKYLINRSYPVKKMVKHFLVSPSPFFSRLSSHLRLLTCLLDYCSQREVYGHERDRGSQPGKFPDSLSSRPIFPPIYAPSDLSASITLDAFLAVPKLRCDDEPLQLQETLNDLVRFISLLAFAFRLLLVSSADSFAHLFCVAQPDFECGGRIDVFDEQVSSEARRDASR